MGQPASLRRCHQLGSSSVKNQSVLCEEAMLEIMSHERDRWKNRSFSFTEVALKLLPIRRLHIKRQEMAGISALFMSFYGWLSGEHA